MSNAISLTVLLVALIYSHSLQAQSTSFDPDVDASSIKWSKLDDTLGPSPKVQGLRFGVVLKNLTNEYWRLIAAGLRRRASVSGVKLDIQAAKNETDQTRQLAIMEMMVSNGYTAILISPQSRLNLGRAIQDAKLSNIPVVDLDGDVVDEVTTFVGTGNTGIGTKVARWFIENYPGGGSVAVIKGQAGVFSTIHRTAGFHDTLLATGRFKIVENVTANWDKQQAYDAAVGLLNRHPDLIGIYCNNDVMALGAVDGVKAAKPNHPVRIFGTDGTNDAYASIRAGELTGTVDTFPMLTAEIGLAVAERLSAGQVIPRVVVSANALITHDNIDHYRVDTDRLRKILIAEEND